ncbi:hypothetical protein RHMOL_Rhmol01G0258700 [Rhododendron molle]|uniref:Uncharacterized protein n=1 Tax=Rhododendron molle TaxID=49168 RepID=A0ACC0Q736_RHOML|nr:hypothetical protein RHMOL_Rhmol01G0258700 [Rhododendron molle]
MAGLFTFEVHHLGRFVENSVRYVEGVANHVDDCDLDLWSKLEVEDIVERLGYPKYKMLRYRIHGLGLEKGLRVIGTEKDAMHMVEVVKGHEQIEIYVEHVIDELDANANVMPFPSLPLPEIREEVVNGENVYYNSDADESLLDLDYPLTNDSDYDDVLFDKYTEKEDENTEEQTKTNELFDSDTEMDNMANTNDQTKTDDVHECRDP